MTTVSNLHYSLSSDISIKKFGLGGSGVLPTISDKGGRDGQDPHILVDIICKQC